MDCKERHRPPVDGDEDFISFGDTNGMASYLQSSLHQPQNSLAMTKSAIRPPAIAMSLRVRESDSISLKHIFDQRMMGSVTASKSEHECSGSNPPGQQMGGSQVLRNRSSPDRRKPAISQLDLTCRKIQTGTFANPPAGFGSPISAPAPANQEPEPINALCMQKDYMPYARVSRPKPTTPMTIFYSGTVNVFDDVPADKAHAIMVLAGNSWTSKPRCPALSTAAAVVASAPSGCTEMMVEEGRPSPLKARPPQPETTPSMSTVNTNGAGIVKNVSSTSAICAQNLLSIASAPARSTCPENARTTQAAGVPAQRSGGIELPHARKASLARFLEKRKDRAVQVQQLGADQQDPIEEKGEEGAGEKAGGNGKPHDDPSAVSTIKRPHSPSSTWQNSNSSSSSRENVGSTKRTKPDDEDEGSRLRKRSLNEHRFFL